jgi:hypothetical protein
MPFSVRVTKSVSEGSTAVTSSDNYDCDVVTKIDEVLPDGTVDLAYPFTFDANARVMVMSSTQNVTVKTNDSAVPQETINLLANVPIIWEEGSAIPFLGNVNSLFVSNASGTPAILRVILGFNS